MAVGIFGVAAAVVFFVFPLLQKEADDILTMKSEIALMKARSSEIRRVEGLLRESDADLKRVNHVVIDAENPLAFFESLYAIASSSGVIIDLKLVRATPSAVVGTPHFGIEVFIAVDGTGNEVYAFLTLLELLQFQTEIQTLSITGGVTKKDPFRISMNVTALSN